jgi:peroxiredoxin
MKKILSFFIITLFASGSLMAQKHGIADHSDPKGLQVGDAAPEIELVNHAGERFLLSTELKKGPVVLVFYRGNWCPYCSRYLAELSDALPDIRQAGAELVGVSPESEEQLSISHEELTGGMITLLFDADDEIMKSYDVAYVVADSYEEKLASKKNIELTDHNQQEEAMLPVAATYIINTDGMISYRHFDLDYTKRADIKELLTALQKL